MPTNKKKFGVYSRHRVRYTLDGATSLGVQPRKMKHELFNFWTVLVIAISSIGCVIVIMLSEWYKYFSLLLDMVIDFVPGNGQN